MNLAMQSECYSCTTGFILECGLAGFLQFGKKLLHKMYVVVSNGAQKNRPKDKYYFFQIKVFENITDNNTDLTEAQKLSLNFYSQTSGILQ